MVRNMRAVLKKASWGTRRIFGGIRCKKQASTVRKRYSVPKTAFCGTRRIFKGPQNSRLHRLWTASWGTRRIFRGVPCQKQPTAAPDASSVRETPTALFVRSGDPFPCSFDGTRYQKQTFTVPNMRAVLKKASWGTRRIFRGTRCSKQATTVRKR